MCNLYRMDEKDIRLFKDWDALALPPILAPFDQQMYPKGNGLVLRIEGHAPVWDVMPWGVPITLPGKRPGRGPGWWRSRNSPSRAIRPGICWTGRRSFRAWRSRLTVWQGMCRKISR